MVRTRSGSPGRFSAPSVRRRSRRSSRPSRRISDTKDDGRSRPDPGGVRAEARIQRKERLATLNRIRIRASRLSGRVVEAGKIPDDVFETARRQLGISKSQVQAGLAEERRQSVGGVQTATQTVQVKAPPPTLPSLTSNVQSSVTRFEPNVSLVTGEQAQVTTSGTVLKKSAPPGRASRIVVDVTQPTKPTSQTKRGKFRGGEIQPTKKVFPSLFQEDPGLIQSTKNIFGGIKTKVQRTIISRGSNIRRPESAEAFVFPSFQVASSVIDASQPGEFQLKSKLAVIEGKKLKELEGKELTDFQLQKELFKAKFKGTTTKEKIDILATPTAKLGLAGLLSAGTSQLFGVRGGVTTKTVTKKTTTQTKPKTTKPKDVKVEDVSIGNIVKVGEIEKGGITVKQFKREIEGQIRVGKRKPRRFFARENIQELSGGRKTPDTKVILGSTKGALEGKKGTDIILKGVTLGEQSASGTTKFVTQESASKVGSKLRSNVLRVGKTKANKLLDPSKVQPGSSSSVTITSTLRENFAKTKKGFDSITTPEEFKEFTKLIKKVEPTGVRATLTQPTRFDELFLETSVGSGRTGVTKKVDFKAVLERSSADFGKPVKQPTPKKPLKHGLFFDPFKPSGAGGKLNQQLAPTPNIPILFDAKTFQSVLQKEASLSTRKVVKVTKRRVSKVTSPISLPKGFGAGKSGASLISPRVSDKRVGVSKKVSSKKKFDEIPTFKPKESFGGQITKDASRSSSKRFASLRKSGLKSSLRLGIVGESKSKNVFGETLKEKKKLIDVPETPNAQIILTQQLTEQRSINRLLNPTRGAFGSLSPPSPFIPTKTTPFTPRPSGLLLPFGGLPSGGGGGGGRGFSRRSGRVKDFFRPSQVGIERASQFGEFIKAKQTKGLISGVGTRGVPESFKKFFKTIKKKKKKGNKFLKPSRSKI